MATPIIWFVWGRAAAAGMTPRLVPVLLTALALAGPSARGAEGARPAADGVPPSERARGEYSRALAAWEAGPNVVTNALWLARTSFDWAEYATPKREQARVANQGILACRSLIRDHPDLAAAHYYLAMNLGELAETKTLGALALVDQMEQSFKKARQLDPQVDFAGPDRSLGLLYHQAPGWPLSLGSKGKARQHLQEAVRLCPEYPGNHLDLLDAYVAWKDGAGAAREVAALRTLLPSARKEFAGAAWAASWAEWDTRWTKLEAETARLPGGLGPEGAGSARRP